MAEARLLRCEFWTEYGAAGADVRRLGPLTGDFAGGEVEWDDDNEGEVTSAVICCGGTTGVYC